MKKLMTTLSAIVVAFGLHAIGLGDTGTSFEGLPGDATGIAYDIYASGGTENGGGELIPLESGQTYWVTNATDEALELKVIADTSISSASMRPARYETADQYKYLKIKTTLGKPVTRNANVDGSTTSIGDGFYFDSLVRFTAFDSDPTIELGADGKLAIWLKEELDGDIPVATNLFLTAGFLDEDLSARVMQTNYNCIVDSSINLSDGGWHRVTVKAIDNIYTTTPVRPGFVVFIDGMKVKSSAEKGIVVGNLTPVADNYDADGALFPSAVQTGLDSVVRTIKSVSFDGQGDVDDLVFTATAPDFADVKFYALRLGENVASVTYTAYTSGGDVIESGTITSASPSKSIAYSERMYIEVTDIQYATGYMSNGVAGVGPDSETGYYKPAEPNQYTEFRAKAAGAKTIIGDETNSYETVAAAFEAINDSGFSGSATVIMSASFDEGITLDNENAEIVLDLAGNDIIGVAEEPAITVANGTLLVVNSTVEVGHVVGVPADGVDPDPAIAVAVEDGFATLAGGCFDGVVTPDSAYVAITSDAKIRIAENEGDFEELAKCVTPAGYTLEEESGESPVYYVVVEGTVTTVAVNFINGELIVATTNVEIGATLVAPAAPEKAGHTFRAWVTTDDPAEDWDFENDTVAGAMSLIADFDINTYEVTYAAGDYSSEQTQYDTKTWGEDLTLEGALFNRTGYTQTGWSTTSDGAAKAYDLEDVYDTDAAITLYPFWEADEYTITYLYDNGEAFEAWADNYTAPAKYTVEHNVTLPVAGDLNLGTGVTFQGWTNETGDVTGWLAGAKTGPVTVYAKLEVVGPTPTITPGTGVTTVEVEATDSADAISKVVIVPPTGSGIDTAEEQAAYVALFDITAEADSGKPGYYNVTIAGIKDSVVTGVNTDAVAVFSGDTSVTIPQGLYYRITPSTSLPIASVGAGVVSDGSAITVTKPGSTQGFLKVEISASPIAAPAAE